MGAKDAIFDFYIRLQFENCTASSMFNWIDENTLDLTIKQGYDLCIFFKLIRMICRMTVVGWNEIKTQNTSDVDEMSKLIKYLKRE